LGILIHSNLKKESDFSVAVMESSLEPLILK